MNLEVIWREQHEKKTWICLAADDFDKLLSPSSHCPVLLSELNTQKAACASWRAFGKLCKTSHREGSPAAKEKGSNANLFQQLTTSKHPLCVRLRACVKT